MNVYGKSISSSAAELYRVLQCLTKKSAENGHVDAMGPFSFASYATLGQRLERSERTIQRLVQELKRAGLICVRRMGMHSNNRIYLVKNGGSETAKNGGSEIIRESNNKAYKQSVYQNTGEGWTDRMIDEDSAAEGRRQQPSEAARGQAGRSSAVALGADPVAVVADPAAADHRQQLTEPISSRPASRPARSSAVADPADEDHRQQPSEAIRGRQARALAYKRQFEKNLGLADECWAEFPEEYAAYSTVTDIISSAVARSDSIIRVRGAGITAGQYWKTVKDISREALSRTLDRVKEAEIKTGLKNPTSYILAAVYNAAQWERLSA